MPDPSQNLGSERGTDSGTGVPDRDSTTRAPRWAKVAGIAAAALVLLFVVMMFAGGGHGPGRHTEPGGTPSPGVTESSGVGGHTPPEGGH